MEYGYYDGIFMVGMYLCESERGLEITTMNPCATTI